MPQTPSSDSATTRKPETAPPRIATWTASTRLRRAADAVRTLALTLMYMPMIPDAIEHTAPTRNANAVMSPIGRPAAHRDGNSGTSATSGVSTSVITTPMTTAPTTARIEDRRVLASDEGDGALEDRAGDGLHLRGARVSRQHVAGQVQGEEHGDDPGDRDDRQERTRIHQGRRVLHDGSGDRRPSRGA